MNDNAAPISLADYRHKRDRREVQKDMAVDRRNLVRDCIETIWSENPYRQKGI